MTALLQRLQIAVADRYAILREIGQGGMATVYLADDIRHRRQVAVKLLSPELATHLGAERFLREIEISARLNHPHILPLLDSGETDGLLYYVMPYVPGESLRGRLARTGPLPIEEAVRLAKEVAAALDYAHRQGIIHRDVKPENILLHEGSALVADFGIAYAVSAAEEDRLTGTGMSLGTPAYMSPEQATGDRRVDARTDVYALGCVLYEMLSGDPPFAGHSSQAVIARILADTAVGLRALRSTVPENVEAAVKRAMARLPVDRFATAAEFAAALDAPMPAPVPLKKPVHRAWPALAAVAVLALIVAVGTLLWRDRRPPPVFDRHERQLTFTGDARDVAMTTDGRTVAYVTDSRRKLVVRDIDGGGEVIVATDSNGIALPSWSRDGSRLLYRSGANWYEVARLGGARTIVAGTNLNLGYCRTGPWRYCGAYLGSVYLGDAPSTVHPVGTDSIVGEGRILRVSPAITFIENMDPQPSPDGRWIAMEATTPTGDNVVALVDSSGRTFRILDRGLRRGGSGIIDWLALAVRWSPDGGALYYGKSRGPGWSLWTIGINRRTGEARGRPTVALERLPGWLWYEVSLDGRRLAYSGGPGEASLYRVPFDRPRDAKPLAAGSFSRTGPEVSTDGRTIAYVREQSDGKTDIFLLDVDGGQERRLTTDSTQKLLPSWSPDGRRIAYLAFHDSAFALEVVEVGSANSPRRVPTAASINPGGRPGWLPDGHTLTYQRAGNRNWGIIDLNSGSERVLLHDDSLGWSWRPYFSPDGRRGALLRNVPPRQRLWWVDPQTGVSQESGISLSDLELLRWGPDGQLYIGRIGSDNAIRGIDRLRPESGTSTAFARFETPCESFIGMDVVPERRLAICSVFARQVDVWVIDGFAAAANP